MLTQLKKILDDLRKALGADDAPTLGVACALVLATAAVPAVAAAGGVMISAFTPDGAVRVIAHAVLYLLMLGIGVVAGGLLVALGRRMLLWMREGELRHQETALKYADRIAALDERVARRNASRAAAGLGGGARAGTGASDNSPSLKGRGFYGLTPMLCCPTASTLVAFNTEEVECAASASRTSTTSKYARAFTRANDLARNRQTRFCWQGAYRQYSTRDTRLRA